MNNTSNKKLTDSIRVQTEILLKNLDDQIAAAEWILIFRLSMKSIPDTDRLRETA
jgi:hypothetical protein